MDQTGFAARMSRHLGRPVEAACAVRPPGTTIAIALCAGAAAGLGAVAGGSAIFAGVGGGLGALVGYLIAWLRTRGGDRAVAMALVLEDDCVARSSSTAAAAASAPLPVVEELKRRVARDTAAR
jgi:hypothetical protein